MQMNMWAESVYVSGFKDGKKSTEGITADELNNVIRSIKGIGEKRAELIMKEVIKMMRKK